MDLSRFSYSTLDLIEYAFYGFVAVIFVSFIVGAVMLDSERNAFVSACKEMGGVPIVGSYDTRACFKSEVLK